MSNKKERIKELLKIRENKDIIWHYTSMDIFKSFIFGETGLYATHVRFLNDSTEIKHGLGLLIKQYDNCLALLNKKRLEKTLQNS